MHAAKDTGKKNILFLCKCSSNISNIVDFDELKRWARSHKNIDIIAVSNLLCSPDGKVFYSKILNERDVNNIIIAACSPKLHEKTFQDLAEKNNINISRVQMANIREQCAWVTTDPEEATKKAKSLINAAVNRTAFSKDLNRTTIKINSDVLVIGGGIAGIEVAKTMSLAERKTYIIEWNISIGGSIMKTEDLAPNMECSPCLMAPILSDVRDDPNIEVIANAELLQIIGFFGNFTVKVRKKPRFVKDNCIACEECFEACPVSVKNDFHYGLGLRKAIYQLYPGSVPASVVIDKENCLHFTENSCDRCVSVCPFGSINFEDSEQELTFNIGSIVIATGYKNGTLTNFPNFGHKEIDNVYTTYEFESLASSNGPTGGVIKLKNGKAPKTIVVIHCAGSMTETGIPYCSGICCTHAVKISEIIGLKNPGTKVINIHNDLVFTSPKDYRFSVEQRNKGTQFIKCLDLSSITITELNEKNKILVSGTGIATLEADMVVLATGMQPDNSVKFLSDMLDARLDKYGYFEPDHGLLHATGSELDGIYIAGCASTPSNVSASCTQAQAVAGDILSKLIPGREIELEIFTCSIDENRCSGCKLCISVCPYKAINFDDDKNISIINEAICRGCGTCAAACGSGAAIAKHFTDEQINAEIEGLLDESL